VQFLETNSDTVECCWIESPKMISPAILARAMRNFSWGLFKFADLVTNN